MKPRAWPTYLRSAALIVPSGLVWIFSVIVVQPRMLAIWKQAQIDSENAKAILTVGYAVFENPLIIVGIGVSLVVFLESKASWWPRVREPIVFSASAGMAVLTMLYVTWLSICMGLAFPLAMDRLHEEAREDRAPNATSHRVTQPE